MRSLRTTTKSSPRSLQLEKGCAAVKTQHSQKSVNKIIKKKKKKRKRPELSPCHVKTQGEGGCLHSGRELPPDPDHAKTRISSLWDCERIRFSLPAGGVLFMKVE